MVEEIKIRRLCVSAVENQGVDFQLDLLELYLVLSEHFDAPIEAPPRGKRRRWKCRSAFRQAGVAGTLQQ